MIGSVSAENDLARRDLPAQIAGVEVVRLRQVRPLYQFHYLGHFRRHHGMLVVPMGDEAHITKVAKWGWLGSWTNNVRTSNVPTKRMVETRGSWGFKTMVFPDGKRYEMKAGIPGGRRLN
jgi:hypothetical protein